MVSSTQLGAAEKDVENVRGLMNDPRVRHYWDGERRVGTQLQPHFDGLTYAAWDVWLLYGPGVTWEAGAAPEPSWWEHQLSSLRARHRDRWLDAERFASKAVELGER